MMVKNKIRAMWARLTLLVVEDDGMSTVKYSTISDYNRTRVTKQTDR
jgi:hypothetical protein